MLLSLHELLQPARPTRVVDIGANPIDGDPPYKHLLQAGLCQVIGFEPQAEALARLKQTCSAHETYLPYAIGDGTPQTLHLCQYPGWTSTLRPSTRSLDIFSVYRRNARVIGESVINTCRLDDITEIGPVDFLKIDIQGGELAVFRNATATLRHTVVIQTEISFVELYDGQPGFGAVDVELRRQGFIPHCFAALKRAMIAPLVMGNDPWRHLNQLLEADLVYVRDFRDPATMDTEQLRHLCLIAHACYQSYDLALHCLRHLVTRNAAQPDAEQFYIALLNKPELQPTAD